MNFPTDVKYTKDHEWIRVEGEVAYVGITDYAQSELGEIVYVDITTVSGEVVEVNPELEDAPQLINEDAYGKGWIIKIALSDMAEIDGLLSAADYEQLIAK